MNRLVLSHGACVMLGLLCGLLLAYQPGVYTAPALEPLEVCINGRTVELFGERKDGRPYWWWRDQRVVPNGPTERRSNAERFWFDAVVNGRACRLWGWEEARGVVRWRWDEQRSSCPSPSQGGRAAGELPPAAEPEPRRTGDHAPRGDPPVDSGVELPSGFRPKQDPRTGALLLGVDPEGMAADPSRTILASDPATAAEAEDVKAFYERRPDASAQAVARNLPPVVPPIA